MQIKFIQTIQYAHMYSGTLIIQTSISLSRLIQTSFSRPIFFSWILRRLERVFCVSIDCELMEDYHWFHWFATFQIKMSVETFPRFLSVIPMTHHIWQYTLSRLQTVQKWPNVWRSKGWITVITLANLSFCSETWLGNCQQVNFPQCDHSYSPFALWCHTC